MLDVCLLGTGAMMPFPGRKLASALVRRNGRLLLIDCGEGTQVAIRESGWSMAKIDAICITHFHADHIAGLPGLLLTMGTCGRTEPVRMIGPKGLEMVVHCLRVIAPELPYELTFEEMGGSAQSLSFHDARLTAFQLKHVVPCYGYAIEVDRAGKFDKVRAERQGIPMKIWGVLQSGQSVEVEGKIFHPEMVLGPAREGVKLVYCTDTRAIDAIAKHAEGADLFICEGTYGEDEKADKATQHGHMTFAQSATLAKRAGVGELLLTHFSPAIKNPDEYIENAKKIFENASAARDNMVKVVKGQE